MAPAAPPGRVLLYRLVHVDSLPTLLARGALHSPNSTPNDGLPYRTIHNPNVQASRHARPIRCGPGGTCHDYVPFYFGPLSVMLLNLKTGQVQGYNQGQTPLIYLVTSVQRIQESGCQFVFSDGHGLAAYTGWYEDLRDLDKVDWQLVGERYWANRGDDNDRQRRKQAEFLVWQSVAWELIEKIAVLNRGVKRRVEDLLAQFPQINHPDVEIRRNWYYY
jgi:hypothetical protein